jgi:hypothetical protein
MTLLGLDPWSGKAKHGEEILRIAVSQAPMLLAFWVWGREPVTRPGAASGAAH